MILTVLTAMPDEPSRRRIAGLLEGTETVIDQALGRRNLIEELEQGDVDLVVIHDRMLPAHPARWVAALRGLPDPPEVVVIWDRENAVRRASLLAAGCLAVLNHNLPDEGLRDALRAVIERRRAAAPAVLREERPRLDYRLSDFASESPAMIRFLEVARRVAGSESALLLMGETGVGKEHLARAIHRDGARGGGAFLAVNCAALPESLLESELFGHERGAFTGATRTHKGYFELAHGGTIFLDEIAEVPLHLQAKLLRVLDDHRIQRIGSETTIRVDVRIMAATNRNLEEEVEAGRFRRDLYYRLAVVALELPPLRDRREDIPTLLHSYNRHFSTSLGRPLKPLAPEAVEALVRYRWPGNVRELINVMERMAILAPGETIGLEDLPGVIARSAGGAGGAGGRLDRTEVIGWLADAWGELPLKEARDRILADFDGEYLRRILTRTGGRIGETAKIAGISERTLYALMKSAGLRKEDFQAE
ncbi:MAG: sigma-54 interaction domain-containing protein [Candidatus Krumholzibacteriia bacterium]